jgi:tetratricopeptide (TPR) repeat protein
LSADHTTSSSNENKTSPARAEDILLERLKNEPRVAPQIGKPYLIVIFLFILGLGTAIYFFSRSPEKYFVEDQHKESNPHAAIDSSEINSKRMKLAPITDSLLSVIAANPNDDQAHLMLGNVYYEAELWEKAKPEYEFFLRKNPDDANARVDYAFVIGQTTGDYKAAVEEIKKALRHDPEHINALFNAGILTIRADLDDKKKAVREAMPYFNHALAAAKKQGNEKMAEQIEKVIAELKKMNEPAQ